MRKFVQQVKLFEQALNVHHDQCELFVAIDDEQFALVVAVEVHLPIGIAIKTHTLFVCVCFG